MTTTLLGSLACLLGLFAIFLFLGAIASSIGTILFHYVPFFGIIAGAAVIIMGIILISNMKLPVFQMPMRAVEKRGIIGFFIFGLVYGLASTSCSAPLLFSTLFYAALSGSLIDGVIIFIVYAMGMGLPLITTSILIVKAKHLLLRRIVNLTPILKKVSGIVVIFLGIYLLYLNLTYSQVFL